MTGPTTAFSVTCSHFLVRSESTEELRRRLNSAQHLYCLTLQARCPQAELDLRAWRLLRLPPPGHSSPYRIRLSQVPGRSAGPCAANKTSQPKRSISSIRSRHKTIVPRRYRNPHGSAAFSRLNHQPPPNLLHALLHAGNPHPWRK